MKASVIAPAEVAAPTIMRSRSVGRLRGGVSALRHAVHFKLFLANLLSRLLPDVTSGWLRARLYRLAGFSVHPTAFIFGNMRFSGGLGGFYDRLTIEQGAVIGEDVTINLDANVHLGRNVSIGQHVRIYTGTHHIGPGSRRRMPNVVGRPVVVEDGSWIGLGAIILPGVRIGRGSVVAAGSVVMESVPANSYVEGNPARAVRELPWGDR